MSAAGSVLFPVVVQPAALTDHPNDSDRQVHREIVRTLQAHGILALGESGSEALMNAIAGLGDDSKRLWSGLLHALYDNNRLDRTLLVAPADEIARDFESRAGLGEKIRLLIASQQVASRHGVDFSAGCLTANGVDMVMAATIDRSVAVRAASKLGAFAPDTERSLISDAVFRPLAHHSHAVTVFDPHLFDDILGTTRGGRPRDHLEWLTGVFSDEMPRNSTLRLVGEYPAQKRSDGGLLDEQTARRLIDSALLVALSRRPTPLSVEITLVRGPKRQVKASNRYLVFSCGISFNVTHDILRLGSPQVPGPDPFALNRLDPEQMLFADDVIEGYRNYTPETARLQWAVSAPVG